MNNKVMKLRSKGLTYTEIYRPYYIIKDNGCWIWVGGKSQGYGYIKIGKGKERRGINVHRLLYEEKYGPIPEGLQLDHVVCSTKACCNPDHVIPVTIGDNLRRFWANQKQMENLKAFFDELIK